ncbi:MAG: M23 family metallopeptidase [Alphaproteobacteria bacterium]|nr:M23 family metallopeptidase [Alphaproteobacteria bacterium]
MKKITSIFLMGILPLLAGCDLQPKIISLPDSVGDFISERYPALLADPDAQPEIYNSAVSDYGVYESSNIYGSYDTNANVMYGSVDDYVMPEQRSESKTDDYLVVPMYGGVFEENTNITTSAKSNRTATKIVTVGAGDTLYSLSRKYSVPVNDLAVMNNLDAPFALSVGQQIRVPDNASGAIKNESVVAQTEKATVSQQNTVASSAIKKVPEKISSDPTKKLPTISARSSSKFSWPVRGKVVSEYGAKSNGLFNDGINISAKRGTAVSAAENGVVAYAGNEVKGMGNLIILQHSGGWMTVYAHMDKMLVKRGAKVTVGQQIGTVGTTGKVDGPQLHFEVRKGTKAYNPQSYLKK